MADLEGLKKVLRSLVVSSAATMDAASLLRDYRRMLGEPLPSAKHGFRDPVQFLRERCSDCFLFAGSQNNPILTLIVPDSIKHIDQLVQSQKTAKLARGKRRSVPESIIRKPQPNLISSTFIQDANKRIPTSRPTSTPYSTGNAGRTEPARAYTESRKPEPAKYVEPSKPEPAPQLVTKPVAMTPRPITKEPESRPKAREPESRPKAREPESRPIIKRADSEYTEISSSKMETQSNGHSEHEEGDSHQRLQRFLKKRMPVYQWQQLGSRESLHDDDSGRQTSSSLSERSATALATLQAEIVRLVARRRGGLWCSELLRLYEEEYGRELNFARFRYPSVSACASAVPALAARRAPGGDWLLTVHSEQDEDIASEPALRLRRAPPGSSLSASRRASRSLLDADDALPGIDYDPDVYPPDCLSFLESIPAASLAGVAPGDMLPLVVGEVYSPSHLWVQRLGPEHDLMHQIMDEMTEYYSKGEGAERVLAAGARRPGQYCGAVFEGDWHRALVVQLVDSDTVKVRHVDYGTVDTVEAARLRPLRREWGRLPAQALRARLAGLRPAARSRRWPRAAAAHCLRLVRERRLVGNVVAVDREESILEVFLIDTATDEDVNITEQMIRAGHADARAEPALGAREGYLRPGFPALEAGATPSYSEVHALLQHGIALDFVDAYRAHVAGALPSSDGEDCGAPPLADNRVPLAVVGPAPLLCLDSREPSPEPGSTPAASSAQSSGASSALSNGASSAQSNDASSAQSNDASSAQSSELDSPVPELTDRCITPARPAQVAPAPPTPAPSTPAPPSTPTSCCAGAHCPAARTPHPAAFYALPCCPCPQACKPQAAVTHVPVSLPLVRSYAPGYYRPRVSPQQYFPQFKPPVTMNYYSPPGWHQHPPNFRPNPPHNFHQFVPNPQQFVPNLQNFGPNPAQNQQRSVPNSVQNHQQFASPPSSQNISGAPVNTIPNPAQNPQRSVPNFVQNHQQFASPPNSQNIPGTPVNTVPNSTQNPQRSVPNHQQFVSPRPNSQHSNQGASVNIVPNSTQGVGPGPAPNSPHVPSSPSPQPQPATGAGQVRLSVDECEVFELLARVDAGAAQRYMLAALRRARGPQPPQPAQPPLGPQPSQPAQPPQPPHGPQPSQPAQPPQPPLGPQPSQPAQPPQPPHGPQPSQPALNPEAAEFRATPGLRPPPGFENFIK